eukprot:CAMPEP_0118681484 /NCGR_PEP_ID=MMETSP0800-20121206/4967_1 /TAXON_ID=210618 ORGANISM="Striatella unipunctata, Strain CCMP2910" /NCGR_SAMPLE_ID=MMETSP0800 /ASSEMBLY_ACC=CAM_ASM_000638 /LENGTH=407 /DNA_ID=CAMNT_0006577791 /DNA_START=509 /DNA_END=1732 /DNA_ORIENTATION=+
MATLTTTTTTVTSMMINSKTNNNNNDHYSSFEYTPFFSQLMFASLAISASTSSCFQYDNFQWYLWVIMFTHLVAGSIVASVLIRPSFYNGNRKKAQQLLHLPPPDYSGEWRIDERRDGLGTPKTELGVDFEEVEFPCGSIRMAGNATLRGWFIPGNNNDKQEQVDKELCIVVCHGGGRDRRQHLRHVPHLRRHYGASVFLFDKQEHGLSDGKQRGIGWFSYEGSDVYAACKYMKVRYGFKRVVAMGTSFGAAGVLVACGTYDEAGRHQVIDGIIAENPPHSRYRFVRDLCHMHGANLCLPHVLREWIGLFTYFCLLCLRGGPINPSDAIHKIAPRPLLITHGEKDSIVPISHGMDLFEAAQHPKDHLWVPDCEHTHVFDVDPSGWKEKTRTLLDAVMQSDGGRPHVL